MNKLTPSTLLLAGTYSQEMSFSITLGAMTMADCGEDSLDQQYL